MRRAFLCRDTKLATIDRRFSPSASAHCCLQLTCRVCALVAWQSFGGFMLYEWRRGEETQLHAVPGYIYLVVVLGSVASFSNAMSYMGACSRSVCLLSASLYMVLVVLLLEAVLALVLFFDPALVDNEVCPPDDAACLARIDNLFKDPSAHAGLTPSNSLLPHSWENLLPSIRVSLATRGAPGPLTAPWFDRLQFFFFSPSVSTLHTSLTCLQLTRIVHSLWHLQA